MRRSGYRRPAARPVVLGDAPAILVVHEDRYLAPAIRTGLGVRATIVGDTAYGAAAAALAELLAPQVVVTGELLDDGAVEAWLPNFLRCGARVVVVADTLHPERAADLVLLGASGVRSLDDPLAELLRTVREVAAGGVHLPPSVTFIAVQRWRSLARAGAAIGAQELSEREQQVLNASLDGLSTIGTARLLGISPKTVEAHRARLYTKLGVRNHGQLLGRMGHSGGTGSRVVPVEQQG